MLIGCVMVLVARSAFAQNGNGPLGQILNSYQNATNQWMNQLQTYARDLFVALAGIEFAWTAIILLLEQRELEGWVAAFIKKLMGISFFYAVLLYAPTWIPAIINSFTTIGQTVGGTGNLTPDTMLQAGVNLGGQVLNAAGAVQVGLFSLGNIAWILLLGAIAVVIIICYVAITFAFIMAQVEGFIVISAGMVYLGFGGSRWTSSYVERFLASAVTTGIRIMVFFLIIGLGQTLAQSTWVPAAQNVASQVNSSNYGGAAQSAFILTAGIIIFTALAFRLPKLVGAVLSGSPSLSGGDLAGGVGSIVGGAAAVAGMIAAPEMMAAKAGASAGAGAQGAMSASKAAGAASGGGSSMGMGGVSSMGSAGNASLVSPPSSGNGNGAAFNKQPTPPSSSSPSSSPGSSRSASMSSSSLGNASNASGQPQPPASSLSRRASTGSMPSSGSGGNGAGGRGGSVTPPSPPSSPSSNGGGVGTEAGIGGASPVAPTGPSPESAGSSISADSVAPPSSPSVSFDSGVSVSSPQPPMGTPASGPPSGQPETSAAQNFFHAAGKVRDGLNQAQGMLSRLENDGGGVPVSVPPPEVRE